MLSRFRLAPTFWRRHSRSFCTEELTTSDRAKRWLDFAVGIATIGIFCASIYELDLLRKEHQNQRLETERQRTASVAIEYSTLIKEYASDDHTTARILDPYIAQFGDGGKLVELDWDLKAHHQARRSVCTFPPAATLFQNSKK